MAFDKKPSTWLGAGYGVTTHVAGFNTNDASSNKLLTQLTDTDADPTTGDIRTLVFSMLEMLYQKWLLQGVNVPNKMEIVRSSATATGGAVRYTYTIKVTVVPGATVLAAE